MTSREERNKLVHPSLCDGCSPWSTLGGNSRSFVEVVQSNPEHEKMYGREGYGGARRVDFGTG